MPATSEAAEVARRAVQLEDFASVYNAVQNHFGRPRMAECSPANTVSQGHLTRWQVRAVADDTTRLGLETNNFGGFVLAPSTNMKGYAHVKFNGKVIAIFVADNIWVVYAKGAKLSQFWAERFAGHNQLLSSQIIANHAIAGTC